MRQELASPLPISQIRKPRYSKVEQAAHLGRSGNIKKHQINAGWLEGRKLDAKGTECIPWGQEDERTERETLF